MEMMDSLKKICLENNNIKDRGAIALAKCLEENDTMLSIYLENNAIGRDGAVALGEMFSNKFKLSKLNINSNPIGDEGFKSIANGLTEIETLRNFTMADCNLSHASIPYLSKCL
jgi:Ran GTPase-activating protein (RanGAP) involved in mRNA processing and transport